MTAAAAGAASLPQQSLHGRSTPSTNNNNDHVATSSSQGQLVRPSSLSVRPQLGIQTRIRSRSINSGTATPIPQLSPTLKGSPVLGHDHNERTSNRRNARMTLSRTLSSPQLADYHDGSDSDSDAPTLEAGSTTDTDSPPATPNTFIRPTDEWNALTSHQEHDSSSSSNKRSRSKTLTATSHHTKKPTTESPVRQMLRRGRSFTTLLMQPVLPSPRAVDRPDPIQEFKEAKYSPPPTDDDDEEDNDKKRKLKSGNNNPVSNAVSYFPPPPAVMAVAATPSSIEADTSMMPTTKTMRDFVPQIALLGALFVASFILVALLVATLPNLFIPHALSDLPALTSAMSEYRQSSWLAEMHLFTVLTVLFLWKQCFSIPGSVLTNILFGALYGTIKGTIITCVWTALGSTGAYGIALIVAPLVEYYFSKPLNVTRKTLHLPDPNSTAVQVPLSTGDLFSHLLLARFFPLLPYSVLNVISGVLRLPVSIFFITLVIGSFPFNFVTVSIGQLVAIAATDPTKPLSDKIWSRQVLFKLCFVTIVSVVPLLFKKQIKQTLSNSTHFSKFVLKLMSFILFCFDRFKDGLVRRLFGFGTVSHGRSNSAPASTSQPFHRIGTSRRKWNRSWGGDGWQMEKTSLGSHVNRSLMSRWDGDEGDAVALMQEEGDVDDAVTYVA
ncbi:hypothetical protein OIO90_004668 [Microbotryomycetes sp. JL221]|nr:hypothetical protein OIO90_004668 [Microbotryomycetes sp. JL221]